MSDTASRNASGTGGTTALTVVPPIKAREDVDGCGCLDCRGVETETVRRTVLDTLVWSVGLFRDHPSIVVVGAVTILLNRLLETNLVDALPSPAVGGLETLTAFAFVVVLRAYVATFVASDLTGHRVTVRDAGRRTLDRVPALTGVFALVVSLALLVPSLMSMLLLFLVTAVTGNPIAALGFPAVVAVGGVLFVAPLLFVLFKFWFAPEACVIGQYGPVESLRISWHITTNYRAKFLLVVFIATGSAVGFYLPEVTASTPAFGPVLHAVSASVGEFMSMLWAGAYAHNYVQGVLD